MPINVTVGKRVSLAQKVLRKDGRVEDLGEVAYWHYRRSCRVLWRVEFWLRRARLALERRS